MPKPIGDQPCFVVEQSLWQNVFDELVNEFSRGYVRKCKDTIIIPFIKYCEGLGVYGMASIEATPPNSFCIEAYGYWNHPQIRKITREAIIALKKAGARPKSSQDQQQLENLLEKMDYFAYGVQEETLSAKLYTLLLGCSCFNLYYNETQWPTIFRDLVLLLRSDIDPEVYNRKACIYLLHDIGYNLPGSKLILNPQHFRITVIISRGFIRKNYRAREDLIKAIEVLERYAQASDSDQNNKTIGRIVDYIKNKK